MTNDKAMVLYKMPYKGGFIVELFTFNHGKISVILPSRKSKTNPIGNFQSLTLINCFYNWKENADFQYLKSSSILSIDNQKNLDPIKSCIQLFLADFLRNILLPKQKSTELFVFFQHIIDIINHSSSKEISDLPCYCLLKSAKILGFEIPTKPNFYFNITSGTLTNSADLSQRQLNPHQINYIEKLEGIVFDTENVYISDYKTRSSTFDDLYYFICVHVNHFKKLNSFEVLKQIMN